MLKTTLFTVAATLLLTHTVPAKAGNTHDLIPWDDSLQYKVTQPNEKASQRFVSYLEDRLAKHGLYKISPHISSTNTVLNQLDAIFTDVEFKQTLFVRMGVTPTKKSEVDKILAKGNGEYLFHGKTKGANFAIYVRGVDKDQLNTLLDQVDFVALNNSKLSDENNRAPAQSQDLASGYQEMKSGGSAQPNTSVQEDRSFASSALQATYGCMIGGLKGVWDSTGGLVSGVVKTGYKVIAHPIQSATDFWDGANQVWDVTKSFWNDFNAIASRLYKGFDNLDPKMKGEISCEIISTIGVGALIAYFTVGAGAPAAMAKIAAAFAKLEEMPKFAAVLDALKVANKAKVAKEIEVAGATAEKAAGAERAAQAAEATKATANAAALKEKGAGLVKAMESDVFYKANPFNADLGNSAPMKEILKKGVVSVERKMYRTTQNVRSWNSGYDMVVYKITHPDGTTSIIQAFKHANGNPFAVMGIGSADMRDTYNMYYVSSGQGQLTQYMYQNGKLVNQAAGDLQQGIEHAEGFVNQSVAGKGLTEITDPNQIVVLH